MLSSNNHKEAIRQSRNGKQRFALKKLTVGVASVLVGFSFMGINAMADQQQGSTPTTDQLATAAVNQSTNTNNQQANEQSTENDPVGINSWNYDIFQNTAHQNGGQLWGWSANHNSQDVIIDSYKGSNVSGQDLVVPNAADLLHAGIITDVNAKVYVNPHTFETTKAANSIVISGTNGQKVYAVPGNWDQGFGSGNAKYTKLDLTNLDVSAVTGMNGLFQQNPHLTQLIGLENWDVHNVKSTNGMFRGDSGLINLDLSNWDLSNVEDAHSMFDNCKNLQSIGNVAHWNFGNATDLSNLFYGDSSLRAIDGLDSWQTDHVTNMGNLFSGSGLTDLSAVANWHVQNVTSMNNLFSNMANLQNVDVSGWQTKHLEDMSLMFMLDRNLTYINGLDKLDTSKVTNMNCLFYITPKLTDLTGISDWNTAAVTNMGFAFANNGSEHIDLHNWNFDHVTNVAGMFQSLANPATIILNDQHPSLTSFAGQDFKGGKPLVVISTTPDIQNLNQATVAYRYRRPDKTVYTENVIGRQNTNYLLLAIKDSENASPVNIIKVPMDFVYSSADDVYAAVNRVISVDNIKQLLQSYDAQHNTHWADQWNQAVDTDNNKLKASLKQYLTLFTTKDQQATLPAQVTGRYVLTMYKSEPVTPVVPTPVYDSVHINYVDKNEPSHVLKTSSVIGKVGQQVEVDTAINANVPANWKIDPAYQIPTMADVFDQIQVPLIHDSQVIVPTDPTDPTDQTQQDLFKAITRTIHVNQPDGKVTTHLQTVNYQRNKVMDLVTNKVISYGEWQLVNGSNSNWPEFKIPQIDDYTSLVNNQPSLAVPQLNVDVNSNDQTIEVTYLQNETSQQPSDHGQTPTNNDQHKDDNSTTKPVVPTFNGQYGANTSVVFQASPVIQSNESSHQLPQTGSADGFKVIGLGLMTMSAMFALGMKKRKF